jgi:hypothetical protein
MSAPLDRDLWRAALIAALVLTLANAVKPLVIDDTVYVTMARHVVEHPADPYGFELYWYDAPEPAMRVGTLAPVLPYWLAGAMALFGDHPFAWKLSLFPFALALTGSIAFLLLRFARPLAIPVLYTLVLGPTVLPGMSLMLDFPALALGLLGFALFVRACEQERWRLAFGAGLVVGLAMQTKYSGVLYPALVLAYGVLYRRRREAAVALLAAGALFVGWESWLAVRHGQSHFLAGIARVGYFDTADAVDPRARVDAVRYWTASLVSIVGGTAAHAGLLALAGLGARRSVVLLSGIAALLVFALLPVIPPLQAGDAFFGQIAPFRRELVAFVPLGVCVFACLLGAALVRLRQPGALGRRADLLLFGWLLLELVGYFVISPYPAVRRLIGVSIAATLLAARAAVRRLHEPEARAGVRAATVFGLALAALYYGSELSDAWTRRVLIDRVAQRLSRLGASPERETIWYTGHWEVQFYGERAGWHPVIAGESQLRRGDWLVISPTVDQPRISYPPRVREVAVVSAISPSPWSTIPAYYSGSVPLGRQDTPHALARIYRVTEDMEATLGAPPPAAGQ